MQADHVCLNVALDRCGSQLQKKQIKEIGTDPKSDIYIHINIEKCAYYLI